jgi:hypothetical protein
VNHKFDHDEFDSDCGSMEVRPHRVVEESLIALNPELRAKYSLVAASKHRRRSTHPPVKVSMSSP